MNLHCLLHETWKVASSRERLALAGAADLDREADPAEIFRAIPRATRPIPPMFSRLLWDELEPEEITRMELADVPLSAPVARALRLSFAHELGTRVDRAFARLGGKAGEAYRRASLKPWPKMKACTGKCCPTRSAEKAKQGQATKAETLTYYKIHVTKFTP